MHVRKCAPHEVAVNKRNIQVLARRDDHRFDPISAANLVSAPAAQYNPDIFNETNSRNNSVDTRQTHELEELLRRRRDLSAGW